MLSGAATSLWPEVAWRRLGAWGTVRLAATGATGVMMSIAMATAPARAVGEPGLPTPAPNSVDSVASAQSGSAQSGSAQSDPAQLTQAQWDAFERRDADPHGSSRKPTTLVQQQAAQPLNHLPKDGEFTH